VFFYLPVYIVLHFSFLFYAGTRMSDQYALDYFVSIYFLQIRFFGNFYLLRAVDVKDKCNKNCYPQDTNRLETYEEISNERNDIFANLTFRFACKGMPPGFYADIDYNCRIFHVCDNFGGGFPVLCANYTGFDQRQRICTDQEDIDCQHAHEWYILQYLQIF